MSTSQHTLDLDLHGFNLYDYDEFIFSKRFLFASLYFCQKFLNLVFVAVRDLPSYKELISFRRAQSDRSLLVSVVGHHGDLYKTCQRHGRVSALFPFSHNERVSFPPDNLYR